MGDVGKAREIGMGGRDWRLIGDVGQAAFASGNVRRTLCPLRYKAGAQIGCWLMGDRTEYQWMETQMMGTKMNRRLQQLGFARKLPWPSAPVSLRPLRCVPHALLHGFVLSSTAAPFATTFVRVAITPWGIREIGGRCHSWRTKAISI